MQAPTNRRRTPALQRCRAHSERVRCPLPAAALGGAGSCFILVRLTANSQLDLPMSMLSVEVLDRTARRITGTIFTTESLFSAAFLAAVTLQSINAAELGGGDQYAGIPSTISLLGRAAIAIPIGVLMDRAGRRPALLLGYLFGTLGFAVSAVAVGWSSFFLLCLGAGLASVANGSSQQARYIASEVWPSDRRARIIGLIVFAGTIGAIFGPLLVAPAGVARPAVSAAVYAEPYRVGTVLTVLAALLDIRPAPPRPEGTQPPAQTQRQEESGLSSATRVRCGRSSACRLCSWPSPRWWSGSW